MAAGGAADSRALSMAVLAHAVDRALVRTRCTSATVPAH